MKIKLVLTNDDAKALVTKVLTNTLIAGEHYKVIDVEWSRYSETATFELESVEPPAAVNSPTEEDLVDF